MFWDHIRLPTVVLSGKSPYELVYKSEPSLLHLKTFGCLCFSTVLKESDKSGHESNEPYDDGGDCADIDNEPVPNKSTHEPRVIIVDSVARNKDNTQFKTKVSVSDSDSVDVTGSTSSRKDTRKEKYATETSVSEGIQSTSLNDDEYESEGEDIESFGQ
ncbi:hypothetical protein Tco_0631097 [Tanacetum coccineum]